MAKEAARTLRRLQRLEEVRGERKDQIEGDVSSIADMSPSVAGEEPQR